ncbi:T9SS type A sorting domain-containing protein [Hymenobacter sp. BT18]|uniref:Ig-like domain-containing protein n=1 Tax=Hymenobacter sp. BT18 TaxID=2835648 RepID=UPI00143E756D|nr:T9SS type A sorting domain-containing protein [Hymenobacter sp. BT18]QIX60222.1 T9SS type A sorting domain-containing protein [Hymenobacter sp. BT18]
MDDVFSYSGCATGNASRHYRPHRLPAAKRAFAGPVAWLLLVLLATAVLRSTPAQAQWTERNLNSPYLQKGVIDFDMPSANVVWGMQYDASGANGPRNTLFLSTDAGATWVNRLVSSPNYFSFSSLSALSATTAFIGGFRQGGFGGVLLKTTDGGASFTELPIPALSFLNVAHFFNASVGVILSDATNGEYEIFRTTDGGQTWIQVPDDNIPNVTPGDAGLTNLYTTYGDHIWFGTFLGHIYHSSDRGVTWSESNTGIGNEGTSSSLRDFEFTDALHGLAIGRNGKIARTQDGGATWELITPCGDFYGTVVTAVPGLPNTLVGIDGRASNRGSSVSYDGGQSWTRLDAGTQYNEVIFFNATTGWAGGVTRNGGQGGVFQYTGPTLTIPVVTTTSASRCGPGAVTLQAQGTQLNGAYRWYTTATGGTPISGVTSDTYSPVLTATTTYYVSATAPCGDFETARVAVTGTINPVPGAPSTTSNERCGPGTVTLAAAGTPAGGSHRWYTTATGGTPIGGATTATYTTPSLTGTTTYYVSTVSSAGCESATRRAVVATINPIPAAPTTTSNERCGPGTISLQAAGAPTGGTYRWYTAATGGTAISGATAATYSPALSATTTFYVSTLSSAGCESTSRTAVTATINALPTAPTTTADERCGAGSVTLQAQGAPTGGSYRWYTTATTGAAIGGATLGTYTTPSLSTTTTYYVSIVNALGCESATRTAVVATINPLPTAPTTTAANRCGPGELTLGAAGTPAGGSYRWYTSTSGGTPISGATSATYTTPSLTATTTYYVSTVSSLGCESATRTAVVATVNAIPAAPTTTSNERCGTGAVTLTAQGAPAGGSYRWYAAATGGTAISGATATTYSPNVNATTTYYVSTVSSAGCESATRTAVTATVNALPTAPTTMANSRCGTGAVSLEASGAPAGGAYRWYTTATGGAAINGATGATYTTPSLAATTTYYVSTVNSLGCESAARTAVVATINALPTAPTVTAAQRCGAGELTLGAAGASAGGSYRWYTSATGSTAINGATTNAYTTPSLSASTTYYVSIVNEAGCESATRAAVAATINALPVAPTVTAPATVLLGQAATLSISGPATGVTYTWTGPGLSATSGSSVQATPTATGTATYTVTATTTAGCTSSAQVSVTVMIPTVSSLLPAEGPIGSNITLTGTGFSMVSKVLIGNMEVAPTSKTDTELVLVMPDVTGSLTGPQYAVQLTYGTTGVVSAGTFTVTSPYITSLSATQGAAGTVIQVMGQNFRRGGQAQVTGIQFNGLAGTDFSVISDTEAQVTVPAGATTGKVTLESTLNSGQGLLFTVTTATPNKTQALATQVQLYPNPAQQRVQLQLPTLAAGTRVHVSFYNSVGQQVKQQPVTLTSPGKATTVELAGLPNGLYLVRIQLGDQLVTKSLIVE